MRCPPHSLSLATARARTHPNPWSRSQLITMSSGLPQVDALARRGVVEELIWAVEHFTAMTSARAPSARRRACSGHVSAYGRHPHAARRGR